MKIDIENMDDLKLNQLVNNRWSSSDELWDVLERTYKTNTAIYENRAGWLDELTVRRKTWKVQANRIFVNMEAVINSLIANLPGINIISGRKNNNNDAEDNTELIDLMGNMESYFKKKYSDRNIKETVRMGLRNLYFGRFLVIKPFWNTEINDFDFKALDPRKVRISKNAKNADESDFAIEEIDDDLSSVVERFPEKKTELMKKFGFATEEAMYIKNPPVTYKEAWIGNWVIFKLGEIILDKIKNPYWDWDGLLVTRDEEEQIKELTGEARRDLFVGIKGEQETRKQNRIDNPELEGTELSAYLYNHFDNPRKPYITATIFNNENKPIGRTDMITLSKDLQRGIDKRKMDIDENAELMNGIIKIDSDVMDKADAQRLRFETKGMFYGKGVVNGVQRETGPALPNLVFDDMTHSEQTIDNIMAATSAFKGEREGQETKAGRLALIQQSFLRLNELVQVVDYVNQEIFNWGYQLAKTRYNEYHYAKWIGKEDAQEVVDLIQDDFDTGSEIVVIPGKTLPEDDEFRFLQAQNDVAAGFIAPPDYLRLANYDNVVDLSQNAVKYQQNPAEAVGLTGAELPLPAQPGQVQPEQATEFMNAGIEPSTLQPNQQTTNA